MSIGTVGTAPDLSIICPVVLPMAYFLFKTYRHLMPVLIEEGESIRERLGTEL